jgi:hypothetical protein
MGRLPRVREGWNRKSCMPDDSELEAAFADMKKRRIDALVVVSDHLLRQPP